MFIELTARESGVLLAALGEYIDKCRTEVLEGHGASEWFADEADQAESLYNRLSS